MANSELLTIRDAAAMLGLVSMNQIYRAIRGGFLEEVLVAGVRLVLELGEKLDGTRRRVVELEELVRLLAERVDQRPSADRYEIVKTQPAGMEVHRSPRRTGSRGPATVQRARPLLPPELRTSDA